MLIDAHAHIHPCADELEWDLIASECRHNGVSHLLVSAISPNTDYPSPTMVRESAELGRRLREYLRGTVQMLWFVYLNPQNENWRKEMELRLGQGANGIKLWISLKDALGSLEKTRSLLAYANEKKIPVLFHVFNRTGGNRPGEINIREFADLAEEYPETVMIAGHAGGNFRHSFGVLRNRAKNAYVEIGGSLPDAMMVEDLVRDIGSDRILFGSDLPTRSLPAQMTKVLFADISEEDKQKILWKNAARIFGLEDDEKRPDVTSNLRPLDQLPDFSEDHYCYCGEMPFFRTRHNTPEALDKHLGKCNIAIAYCGHLNGLYRMDLEAANNEFLEEARSSSRIRPLATINPLAENWLAVLESAGGRFAGIVVHPYIHAWNLVNPARFSFYTKCAKMGLPLWINCNFIENRFRHTGVAVRDVGGNELAAFCSMAPRNRYTFQGVKPQDAVRTIRQLETGCEGDVYFDISRMIDCTWLLDQVFDAAGKDHLVMGAEFPLRDLRSTRWAARRNYKFTSGLPAHKVQLHNENHHGHR